MGQQQEEKEIQLGEFQHLIPEQGQSVRSVPTTIHPSM